MTSPPNSRAQGKSDLRVDFRDPFIRSNPHQVFRAIREASPVCRIKGLRSYLVTGYQESLKILESQEVGFEEYAISTEDPRSSREHFSEMRNSLMLFQNPPVHPESRQSAKNLLSQCKKADLRGLIRETAQDLIAAQKTAPTSSWDFVEKFAKPFAWRIIKGILRLPEDTEDAFSDYVYRLADSLDPFGPRHSLQDAGVQYRQFANELLALFPFPSGKSQCPYHDTASPSEVLMLLAASLYTTTHILSLSVHSLLADSRKSHLLQRPWAEKPSAVEELLRFHSPAQLSRRVAKSSFVLRGEEFPAGTVFWISVAAANRDPEEFSNPDELLLNRKPNRHLAFGKGEHSCMGPAWLVFSSKFFSRNFRVLSLL